MGAVSVDGLVLAAGAGRRAGGPKALRRDDAGTPWVERGVRRLEEAGCHRVLVVLGAAAVEARPLVPSRALVVLARDWSEGLSASLRAGLSEARGDAALVTLVDLPDEPASVGARLLATAPASTGVLARAVYGGRPGHPVLIGRDRWPSIVTEVSGDSGARGYLARSGALEIECGDLASGRDDDGPR